MKTSKAGLLLIKKYEGLVDGDPNTPGLDPYLCPAGVPTIGWGSTRDLRGNRITMEHNPILEGVAQALFEKEVEEVERSVTRLIRVPLNENQFSALVSFTYNLGSGNLQSSTLRQKLNRGNYEGAANEFWKWRRAGGRILKGLVLRRASEAAMFRN